MCNIGTVSASDVYKRQARNHTATHIIHKALKEVLGEHVAQAGSLVDDKRLRFDFNHFEKMKDEQIKKVENKINHVVYEALNVSAFETDMETAKEMGAVALFGEKYDDIVRVIKVGDYSAELCGGTHIDNSNKIGILKIVSESGIASGVRRIEAVTGINAYQYINNIENELNTISSILKTNNENVHYRVKETLSAFKALEKENKDLRQKLNTDSIDDYLENVEDISSVKTIIMKVEGIPVKDLRDLADKLRDRLQSGIVLLATADDGKANFVAMGTKDIVKDGFHAGNMIKEIAKIAGGGGGGRPDMAQAGGKKPEKVIDALSVARDIIAGQLS